MENRSICYLSENKYFVQCVAEWGAVLSALLVFYAKKNYFCHIKRKNMNGIYHRSIAIFLSAMLFFSSNCGLSAQSSMKHGYRSITEENSRAMVGFLASDLLAGREAGMPGSGVAADYIISLLGMWGIEYDLQPFRIVKGEAGWVLEGDARYSGYAAAGGEVRRLKNIVAVIPGEGPGFVVAGAHYDHLGIGTALAGDSCYNGADDNASGVSALLQLAKAFRESGRKPRRSIVFAFWDGEELGLLGSKFFVRECSILSDISAYMNFDMIGRGPVENPAHVSYLYTAENPKFAEWLKDDVKEYGFRFEPSYAPKENLCAGSDNAPFAKAGIPIVWYHTEGHPDYHRPSDSAGKIDYVKMLDITRAAYLCLWRLANERSY